MLNANIIVVAFSILGAACAFLAILQIWSDLSAHNEPMEWFEACFVSIISVVAIVGSVGVVLVSFGRYSLLALAVVMWGIGIAIFATKRSLGPWRFKKPTIYEFLLLGLLLGCSIVYFRPHEYIAAATDAGGYVNTAATIAQTGQFLLYDDWTALLKQHEIVALRPQIESFLPRWLQFVGWYIDDTNPAKTIPQFFPFHTVLIAVGMNLAGLYGGLLVTPLWGVLSIGGVYLVARRIFGPMVALLAALLLALTATHIFFVRYPTTESLTLLLVFTGLLSWQALYDRPLTNPLWGLLGGLSFGAAFLTRIDLPLVALLLLAGLLLQWRLRGWSKGWSWFAVSLAGVTVYAIFSALYLNWPYVYNTYGIVGRVLARSPWLLAGAILSGIIMVGLAWLLLSDSDHITYGPGWFHSKKAITALKIGLVGLVILLSLYAYFLRPILEPPQYYNNWLNGEPIPLLNGQNWVRIGWYITPLGLILATLGLAIIMWRYSLTRLALFLAVGVLTTIQYVYNIFNTPYHIYAMRRYVPIIIPMLMIYCAVALFSIYKIRPPWLGRLAGIGLTIVMVTSLTYQSRFVVQQRDFYGAVAELTALNAALQAGTLIIINDPASSLFADNLGPPLQFAFGHKIATIRQTDGDLRSFLEDVLAYAHTHGMPVQLIAVDPLMPAVREMLHLKPAMSFPLKFTMLMNTFDEFPSTTQTIYYGLEIYDVEGLQHQEEVQAVALPTEIDIGTFDTTYVRQGFYYKEPLSDQPSARWASGEAVLEIPMEPLQAVTIEVRAMVFRPDAAPAVPVAVWLDDHLLGQFTPDLEWQVHKFQARPEPEQGISTLVFRSTTFNPAELALSADTRDLAFLLDWVRITAE